MCGLSQKVTGSAHGCGQTKVILSANSLYYRMRLTITTGPIYSKPARAGTDP